MLRRLRFPPIPQPLSRHLYGGHPQNEGRGVFPAFSRMLSPSLFMGKCTIEMVHGFGVGAFQKRHLNI